MTEEQAKQVIDKIVGQIFGFQNPYTLDQFAAKFAFDIRQPVEVTDHETGESTWAQSSKSSRFVKFENMIKREDDGLVPKVALNSMEDVLRAWQNVDESAAERYLDSINVSKSDTVYGSQNVYKSMDVINSKNVVFCDSVQHSEYIAACQRSNTSVYSLRIDDSKKVSNSFQVSWSKNITNCFFIKDSNDLQDCMFTKGVGNQRFLIANMQYTEEEYRKVEAMVKQWILTN